jgi:chorismate mutase/prephenate dehydratase
VNLTRIESRPSRKQAWHYVFLVDVEGHRSDKNLARALRAIARGCDFVKVVGSYPRSDSGRTK